MANKAFPTIPGTIEIPSGLDDFKNKTASCVDCFRLGENSFESI